MKRGRKPRPEPQTETPDLTSDERLLLFSPEALRCVAVLLAANGEVDRLRRAVEFICGEYTDSRKDKNGQSRQV